MAIRIPTNQVVNLQQIEAVVAGPDGANRLFVVAGQLDVLVSAFSGSTPQQTQTFTVLIGPVLTRQQFFRAICTASVAKTSFNLQTPPGQYNWGIASSDADWDDESGQVELRIEVSVSTAGGGGGNVAGITGLAFQVTILAAIAV
jgi:hypothetical protein